MRLRGFREVFFANLKSNPMSNPKLTEPSEKLLTLLRPAIVIAGKTHNPSVQSPEWWRKYCGVVDETVQFVKTPEFCLFECDSFSITTDPYRLQINSKKFTAKDLEKVSSICANYIETLPHIPYTAIGLNYNWGFSGPEANFPKFKTFVSGKEFPDSIDEYQISHGSIVYGTGSDHKLKVITETEEPKKMSFKFNFHFETEGHDIGYIIEKSNLFVSYLGKSEEIIKKYFLKK